MSKSKNEIWFGCNECQIIATPDKKQSTNNWSVYPTNMKCPKCGKKMKLNLDNKPEVKKN
jgi:hypothetical protein